MSAIQIRSMNQASILCGNFVEFAAYHATDSEKSGMTRMPPGVINNNRSVGIDYQGEQHAFYRRSNVVNDETAT